MDGIINRADLDRFHIAGYLLGANVYTTAFASKKGVARFRFTVSFTTAAILSMTIYNGTDTETVTLNAGNALVAGAIYSFDVPVKTGYVYNLQYGANATIKLIQVDEIVQES